MRSAPARASARLIDARMIAAWSAARSFARSWACFPPAWPSSLSISTVSARADRRVPRLALARAATRRRGGPPGRGAPRAPAQARRVRRVSSSRRRARVAGAAFRARRSADRLWEGIAMREGEPARRARRRASAGWTAALVSEHPAGDHTFFVGEVEIARAGPEPGALVFHDQSTLACDRRGRLRPRRRARSTPSRSGTRASEQLARERGGRWHESAQRAMMGMSSHRVVALHARA